MIKTITIRGMHCGHCVSAVEKALRSLPGVTETEVSLENNNAVIRGEGLENDAIKAAVEDIGFDVTEIK